MALNVHKFSNYRLVQQIGRGTYGTVYKCKRLKDSETVVVKEICVNFSDHVSFESVKNEIVILAKLSHPNIIGYHETFYNDHSVFIVMEYASKGTLSSYLTSKTIKLPEMEVLHILSQIAMGVQYIHSKGILHRDLKCENIFLSAGLVVKIGDFGISKILLNQSKAFSVIGTPYYQSPELCQNKPYGYKSDMWAIGCILYEMCTLRKAFDATTLAGLVMKIMEAKITPIDPGTYSTPLWNIIQGLLCFDPDLRPSAVQLLCHPLIAQLVFKAYSHSFQDLQGCFHS
ncbi:serine/threonine-protein kinase Nek8-like [Ctenocephalides felis]|uniref:serine/threonine-protein kinase Nek8-like n=2 Tax=Ctenocephalides felis TaxID=7515 RepID=UPI000E6E140B|nr:serine/threonine-protein kinase Nek8-like [Ctenocephalides felis]